MEQIYLNYKDVAYLTGCTQIDAKAEIYKCLDWSEKTKLITLSDLSKNDKKYKTEIEFIKTSHTVDYLKFNMRINSCFDKMNGEKTIQYIVSQIRTNGISDTTKHEVLEDAKNILTCRITGAHESLNRILTKDQKDKITEALHRRKILFIESGNKIPKSLLKHVEEKEKAFM